jgi:hypothetical protein
MSSNFNNQPDMHHAINAHQVTNLDEMVAMTCFCKLRETCVDKTSAACMKHRNIYQEFMFSRK